MYQVLNPDSTDHWKPNTEYLILANRLPDDDRSSVFLRPRDYGLVFQNCSGAWIWTAYVEGDARRAFGGGRRPE